MTVLCTSTQLNEGQARGFDLDDRAILVVRHKGQLYAYRNRCPHTGVNLEWLPDQFLDASGEYLQCALHGALFRIEDGFCVHGPCAGDALRPVSVQEKNGEILVEDVA